MSFKNLMAYQKAFATAMKIFKLTKKFPKEEIFGITSQMRRSSRSICSNIAEGYRKRKYEAHFISKLTDADTENSETGIWLDFSLACEYITQQEYHELYAEIEDIGKILFYMISNPSKFLPKASNKNVP